MKGDKSNSKFNIAVKLSKDELRRRLENIAAHLQKHPQNSIDKTINTIAASLLQPSIFRHKDSDIKIRVACCLSDILRIHAPHAPYSDTELTRVFELFINQLAGISNTKSPSYIQHYYLLENLTEIQAFCMCFDLGGELLQELFRTLFQNIKKDHPHKVLSTMIAMMKDIVENAEALDEEILEIALTQLLTRKQSPGAYQLARSFFKSTVNSIQACLHAYFARIVGIGSASESSLSDNVYELIEELMKIDHDLLITVLPQLEMHLKFDENNIRQQTTALLGRIFCGPDHNLMTSHKNLWNAFLGRKLDRDPDVRLELAELLGPLISKREEPQVRRDINQLASTLLLDPDESVRIAAVTSFFERVTEHVSECDPHLLDLVMNRRLDKKISVRIAVIRYGCKFFHSLCKSVGDCDLLDISAQKSLIVVSKGIIRSFHIQDLETRNAVVEALNDRILRADLDPDTKAARLGLIWKGFDAPDRQAFVAIIKNHHACRRFFTRAFNHNELEEHSQIFDKSLLDLARMLPDEHRIKEILPKLLSITEGGVHEQLQEFIASDRNAAEVFENRKKILKLHGTKNQKDHIDMCLSRASPFTVDQECLVCFCKRMQSNLDKTDAEFNDLKTDLILLKALAEQMPQSFQDKSVLNIVTQFMNIPELAEHAVGILSFNGESIKESHPSNAKKLQKQVLKLAAGHDANKVETAVEALIQMDATKSKEFKKIFEEHLACLKRSDPGLKAALKVMICVAKKSEKVFEPVREKVIKNFILKSLLKNNEDPTIDEPEDVDEWETTISDECEAKILAIQLLAVNISVTSDSETFNVLFTILENFGEISRHRDTKASDQARLRLAAGCAILDILTDKRMHAEMSPSRFQQLSCLMQDSCTEVRQAFLKTLKKHLLSLLLPKPYFCFLALAGKDPEDNIRHEASSVLEQCIEKQREYAKKFVDKQGALAQPEYVLPDLIHLLAHHPDFLEVEEFKENPKKLTSDQTEALSETKVYLDYFLDALCSRKCQSFDFLENLVQWQRRMEDGQTPEKSGGMRVICELAYLSLQRRANQLGWTRKDYPGNICLSLSIIRKPENGPMRQDVRYLPSNYWDTVKSTNSHSTPKISLATPSRSPKRTTPAKNLKKVKKAKVSASKQKKPTQQSAPSRRNAHRAAKDMTTSFYETDNSEVDEEEEIDHVESPMSWHPTPNTSLIGCSTPKIELSPRESSPRSTDSRKAKSSSKKVSRKALKPKNASSKAKKETAKITSKKRKSPAQDPIRNAKSPKTKAGDSPVMKISRVRRRR
eukprot:m.142609 g.142609  ORF g.142609 m.142609 type:complete len:1284 (-) comp14882_c0_seq1:985-4836(-)